MENMELPLTEYDQVAINFEEDLGTSNSTSLEVVDLASNLELDEKYDLFLSHSSKDETEVREVLEILESEPYNLKCCIDRRDFMPGQTTSTNINNAFDNCIATVIFLTPNFINSRYCDFEMDTAWTRCMENKGNMIPVMLHHCDIPEKFKQIQYIDDTFPEGIARTIHKTFVRDQENQKRNPQSENPASLRVNGNQFPFSPNLTDENTSLLEARGIKITDSLKQLLSIVQTVPAMDKRYHKDLRKYQYLLPFLESCLLANTMVLLTAACGAFKAPKDHYTYETAVKVISFGIWVIAVFIAFGVFYWFHRYKHTLDIRTSAAYLDQVNLLSVKKFKCAFAFDRNNTLNVMKYDISHCEEFIQSSRMISSKGLELSMQWADQYYFKMLCLGGLESAYEIRHQVIGKKICFCQCIEQVVNILSKSSNDAESSEGTNSIQNEAQDASQVSDQLVDQSAALNTELKSVQHETYV